MSKKQIQKLITLEEDAKLAIFDELQDINESLKEIINGIKDSKIEEVKILNSESFKTDLSPLKDDFETLKYATQEVVNSIKDIKNIDLSGVERLLKLIYDKKEEIDLSNLTELSKLQNISEILDNILYAVQSVASTEKPEQEKTIPELKTIQDILNVLNENIISIDIPEFDYKRLANIIKENLEINISGGSGGGTNIYGTVSTVNSSSTLLGISEVFTGTSEDVKDYGSIIIATKSDVASATNGLSIQFSTDGTNWDHIDAHTIPAATSHTLTVAPQARYFRIVYTNGGTGQASFRLQAIFRSSAVGPQMETLSGDVSDTNFALTTRAVLAAKKPNGDYVNIQATAGGNLKVSIEEQNGTANIANETGGNLANIATNTTDFLFNYKISDIDDSTTTYLGYLKKDGAWYIQKITSAGAVTYATGASGYNWSNRASETYDIFSNTF